MAISDIKEYAHLTPADVAELGAEFDRIRRDIEQSRGVRDARYIHKTIRLQRGLEFGGRALLFAGLFPPAWLAGTTMLALSKIIENMEIAHNVLHGQWDWMNDPEIHSATWEWDACSPSAHWKQSHNVTHHKYTNVLGMDFDLGYGLLRITRDQRWSPYYLGNAVWNTMLQLNFEYAVALTHLQLGRLARGKLDPDEFRIRLREVLAKSGRQLAKDYVLFPLLTGPAVLHTLAANWSANMVRNVWAHMVIFCGHFPDGAEKFTRFDVDNETRGEWYLRQMLGSANISGGPVMHFMTGNLSHQIEHHLFPDLPSNRYAEIAVRVRALAEKYDLPYTTGSLLGQYWKAWRTIVKLSLPNSFLRSTADDAPETASERKFANPKPTLDPITGRRRGLAYALLPA